ncbi:transcriptional regulatory [Fusarium subglutinans]|uniref:Transcriptional regulatory n=1 Tax=Gibberella subglutinans TaxID=42677 RepID=A0A8H5Q6E6_GIBSU|nr:transcriptional regulatory [Fusarium subglutinans]KAF5609690.1 transcriptional regulatory [Fusarium subglutinans]
MRPIIPLYSEASSPKPSSRILPPKGKKAVRRWERTGKPKSRSGCGTCKIRRVKCDGKVIRYLALEQVSNHMSITTEARPICVRCAKGRFDCDGYNSDTTREASDSNGLSSGTESSISDVSASPRAPGTPATTLDLTPSPGLNHSESCTWHAPTSSFDLYISAYTPVYMEHFSQNANLGNALFIYSEPFSSILLQETLQDECIQKAVLALGALFHSGFILSQNDVQIEIANHHRLQSLQLYNVALNTFRKRMQNLTGTTSRWIALMTPLLAMYELLQGDFDAADKLLSSTIEGLRSSGYISHTSTSESSGMFSYTSLQLVGDALPLFTMTSKQRCHAELQCDSAVFLHSDLLATVVTEDASFDEECY